MDTTLKNAYAEVNQILDILGEKYKCKIPEKVLKLFNEKQNPNYKINIKQQMKLNKELKISRNALTIISILNLKYWANSDEKKRLQETYKQNELEFQNKISEYKNDKWLAKDKIVANTKEKETRNNKFNSYVQNSNYD